MFMPELPQLNPERRECVYFNKTRLDILAHDVLIDYSEVVIDLPADNSESEYWQYDGEWSSESKWVADSLYSMYGALNLEDISLRVGFDRLRNTVLFVERPAPSYGITFIEERHYSKFGKSIGYSLRAIKDDR